MKTISFYHDVHTRQDEKFVDMFYNLRKESPFIPWTMYGLFWGIVEYLHESELPIEKVSILADSLKIRKSILYKVLNNYNLFEIKDGKYFSNRILKNIEKMNAKNKLSNEKQKWLKTHEETALKIKEMFCTTFDKDIAFSKTTQSKIIKLNKDENLSLEQWQTIFSNAKRGWLIDGENVKPSLKKILDNWERFLNDDYNLAPIGKSKKEQKNNEEKEAKAKEQLDSSIEIALFPFDEYRRLKSSEKLAAQTIYNAHISKGENEAIKQAVLYCRKAAKND